MPLIETSNEEVKTFDGLHLYHFWLSSCSQRVRIVLAEKNQEWTSHEINLEKMEHATPEYQSIHPHGVVPALVHDGQIIIESIDIIDYLDTTFPEPRLHPSSEDSIAKMHDLMSQADGAQHSIKTLTHEFLFKQHVMPPEAFEVFEKKHENAELVDFMRVWSSKSGIPSAEIDSELKLQHDYFVQLDQALEGQDWLVDNTFSLADIAWISNVRRLDLMHYPLDIHPNLLAWYDRFQAKPSYQKGISEHEIPPALADFNAYSLERAAEGTGVRSFKPLAA
ncbi:MAG: glutathione S-transferase family protein [Rhodospirillaceae bacterium]|jgi:glutathione S-transferase|nr:glutathione S-transferase family protein [Rhodospirillaceae bacterium]MBT4590193.1 glutathione S-transferase family protein [Rhodospirillaceae bacterium]MBT4938072.1 glutathione S-transferase family protein [Rhodospirillaceae bacterium]MBT5939529.1 glutathione S-transferase family protein [Rhodospirillaceae bacterium]MBT7267979.1 glutathione S-transferase family protein [Rhodospirillaceae bacterium]